MSQAANPQRNLTSTPITARVLRIMSAGLVVVLPDGREGLVRERELEWDAESRRGWRERYQPGDKLETVVLNKESGPRLELSVRLAKEDPWLDVLERYPTGALVDGVVTGIVSYGVFIEIEPGVTGLVHTSRFPAWATATPGEIFWPSDLVKVIVDEINIAARQMALSLADQTRLRWRQPAQAMKVGKHKSTDAPVVTTRVRRASDLLQHSARSILVVDDSAAVRAEIGEWLHHAGHRVTLAEDGHSALAALRDAPSEIALIDVHLPGAPGTQLVQTIRRDWPEMRCILMSADPQLTQDHEEWIALHDAGIPLLCKPFRPEELLEQIFTVSVRTQAAATAPQPRPSARQRAPQSRSQFAKVVGQLWRTTRVDLVVLFELDPAKRVISIVEQHGRPIIQTATLPVLIHSPVRDVAEDGVFVRATDATEAAQPRFRHLTSQINFASCLGVPVSVSLPNRYALFLFSDQPYLAVNSSVEAFASAAAIAAAAWLEHDAFAQQAAELQRLVLLGQLGRTLVHEINNQVQNIPWAAKKLPGYVDQANHWIETNPVKARETLTEATQILQEVSLEVQRLASIAQPFTSLARLEHESSLLLDTTVEEALAVVQDTAQRANVTLSIQDLAPVAYIRGQDTALHQILVNILLNAVQQIEQARGRGGGRVAVRLAASHSDGQPIYRIDIEDDGPGIHRRLWERIFEMGYTTRPGGSGVGLHVARNLIESMAGRISVAESWLGWGSTFVIELPR